MNTPSSYPITVTTDLGINGDPQNPTSINADVTQGDPVTLAFWDTAWQGNTFEVTCENVSYQPVIQPGQQWFMVYLWEPTGPVTIDVKRK